MAAPFAYYNGRFLPQAQAALGFHDAGFVFGATVTDLCRTFRHRPFRLVDHLTRFRQSCEAARIAQPVPDARLAEIAEELIARNAACLTAQDDLALVLLATPGPIGYYAGQPGGAGDGSPTLLLHTFPLPFARFRRLFREGAHLLIPNTRHLPTACMDPRIKQRSRLHWWLAEQEVHARAPAASALLLDLDGFVTETAAANFLLVRDGTVLSPPAGSVLDGVSLRVVRELCIEFGIPFEEKRIRPQECRNADEALLTCTSYCVAGVRSLDGRELNWPGPVWQRILNAWSSRVGLDIQAQIEGSASIGNASEHPAHDTFSAREG